MIFSVGRSKIYFSMDITSNHLFDGLSVNSSFESVGLRDWQCVAYLESKQNLVRASIFFLPLHLATSLAVFATNLFF